MGYVDAADAGHVSTAFTLVPAVWSVNEGGRVITPRCILVYMDKTIGNRMVLHIDSTVLV